MNKKPPVCLKKTLVINTPKSIPNYRATTPFRVYNYLTPIYIYIIHLQLKKRQIYEKCHKYTTYESIDS